MQKILKDKNRMSTAEHLKSLLNDLTLAFNFDEITDIIQGVLAAPAQFNQNAWVSLICENASDELITALNSYKSEIAAQLPDTLSATEPRNTRLKALRREMANFDVDGFIIPKVDAHQGEYVALCAERLTWISGFSGSAGFAIVLADAAAIFIDGRYTIQVQKEVDNDLFEYRHVTDEPASEWLAKHLKEGMKLAYDPWLHTGTGLMRFTEACKKQGAYLVSAPHNFIDAIWHNRPAAPLSPVNPQAIAQAGAHHNDKIKTIAEQLIADQQDAMFLSLPDSIAWVFNIRGADVPCTPVSLAFALIYQDATADLFIDGRKVLPQTHDHLGSNIRLFEPDDLGAKLDQLGKDKKTVRFDSMSAPKWVEERLKTAGATAQAGDDLCILAKACKNEVELEGSLNAHRRDGAAMVRFLHWLSDQPFGPALNELSASNKVDGFRAENEGFSSLSFPTISGSGAHGAIVHYRVDETSSIPLPQNGLYLVDSGAQYIDGTTDITRTIARGQITPEMKDRFTRVLKGHIAISSARFPIGTTGSQIDILARQALWQMGLDYDHGTGHGVGSFLNVHEGPHRISKMPSHVAFKPGMIVSNEPGYYKSQEYGIRIENLIYVKTSDKKEGEERDMLEFEPLTLCPIDVNAIEVSLLNEVEKDWLNDYHQRVRQELVHFLDEKDVTWLIGATQKI
jgi:Xaa-Pro aminopeptidase